MIDDKHDWEVLVHLCKEKGIKVELVTNEKLHDYAGMNPEAAKSMDIPNFPENTIWIDTNMSIKKKCETLRHEMVELGIMEKSHHYFPAHLIALRAEKHEIPAEKKLLRKSRIRRHFNNLLSGVRR